MLVMNIDALLESRLKKGESLIKSIWKYKKKTGS